MNPLFLLLGLFGAGAMSFGLSGSSSTSSTSGSSTLDTSSARKVRDDDSSDDRGKKKKKDDDDDDDDTMTGGGNHGGGSDDDDTMTGGGDDHGDHGSGGDDTMTGGGNDGGGDGDDTMTGGGDDHGDHGGGGDDTMTGGGNDGGGDGDDTMTGGGDDHGDHGGGGGDDTMTGGGDDHGDHGGGDGDDTMTGDGGGHSGGPDGHGGGGHDHSDPAIDPPGVGASQSAIDAYVQALGNMGEAHAHGDDPGKAGEHMAAMDLVDRGEATHVAIGDGDWFDPNIWSNGEVPGDDAKVLIPEGVSVDYAGVSDARLFTVRIDGTLDFATDENSQMIFDTIVASPTGHLIIGTADNPVEANVDVDLIVADNGRIDTGWDPMLLSRGIIAHGTTTIHGADKDSHEKVSDDPMEGDTSVQMAGGVPTGWQVGDTIVIAGTHYDGYKWDNSISGRRLYPPEDEVRTITQIDDDGRIHFDDPLVHDHDAPREDLKTSVANYTRNVSVESENAEDLEVFERGHVMFMHSDNVDVRYAEFTELGRTDKSEEARDISNIDNVRFDSNVQGRYSLHLHKTGTTDIDNPAVLEGNAVFGSPGWGVVHHDSNAVITNTATYDTFGAGFVAETGNETGVWDDNIAIWSQGVAWETPKNTSEIGDNIFDTARGGEGFWFQGRMVASTNNIAASVNNGFVYFHRDGDDRVIEFDASLFDYDAALYYQDDVRPDDVPILGFQGNEAFAAREGLHVVKANPNQGHDVWSHLDDFTAWSVKIGAHIEYTSHYLLTNFDIVGKEDTQFSPAETGILLGNNTTEMVIRDVQIDGFETGIDLNKFFTRSDWTPDMHNYVVINADITNVDRDYENYRASLDQIYDSVNDLPSRPLDLRLDGDLTYQHSNTYSQSVVEITGTKTDSLGTVDFPGGTDTFEIQRTEVINILENQGYYSTSGGQNYFLIDIYLTDRLTGEIFYETHPVYLASDTLGRGPYSEAQFNGTQNITSSGGQQFAGGQLLNTPIAATPTSGSEIAQATVATGSVPTSAMESQTMSFMAATVDEDAAHDHDTMDHDDMDMGSAEIWMDGYDGEDVLHLNVESGTFGNVGDMSNTDVSVNGGTTVLAAGGGSFSLEAGRTLAVFDAAAEVGFDGDDEDALAILDLQDGSTVSFQADEDGLGTIEEISSGTYGDEPQVASGIDLGNATLSIDLAGLTAEQGAAFTLMDADEIAGVFNEAIVNGLGARNAKIVIDYETDSVSLELSEGDGSVEIETLGVETDVTSGEEDIWAALTNGQGVFSEDTTHAEDDDEHDHMNEAA